MVISSPNSTPRTQTTPGPSYLGGEYFQICTHFSSRTRARLMRGHARRYSLEKVRALSTLSTPKSQGLGQSTGASAWKIRGSCCQKRGSCQSTGASAASNSLENSTNNCQTSIYVLPCRPHNTIVSKFGGFPIGHTTMNINVNYCYSARYQYHLQQA